MNIAGGKLVGCSMDEAMEKLNKSINKNLRVGECEQ